MSTIRNLINRTLAPLGVRMVNVRWGPRGFWTDFEKLKKRGFQPRQIVDAGAFMGHWTLACMQIFPDARYLMVDPLASNKPILERIPAKYPNCRLFSGALGATDETKTVFSDGMRSSLLSSDVFDQSNKEITQVRTLDSFLGTPDLEPPQLIKADVQGYELLVLRGAQRCLQTTELILLEISFREFYVGNPLAHEVVAQLGEWGFAIYDICTYNVDARNGDLLQSDFLFCRSNSPWLRYDGGTAMSQVEPPKV